MTLACFFYVLWIPVENTASIAGYLSSQILVEFFILVLVISALFTLLLMGHLAVSTNLPLRARFISSTSISSVILLVFLMIYLASKDNFRPDPSIYATLKPPFIKIVPSKTIDNFLLDAKSVFSEAVDKNNKTVAK